MRILAMAALAVVAMPLLAMPTRQELKLAEGTVREMMLPEFNALKAGEKSRADVAKAAVARAKMAESEAEKMLLLKGAFVLYARHGAFDEAVEALMIIHTQIPDVPPQIVSNIVESASRTMSKDRRDSLVGLVERMFLKTQTVAMYRSANGRVQLWEGGPYWAEKNIGAENPWDYGYYFWWGDTIGYKRENGAWVASDGSSSNFCVALFGFVFMPVEYTGKPARRLCFSLNRLRNILCVSAPPREAFLHHAYGMVVMIFTIILP